MPIVEVFGEYLDILFFEDMSFYGRRDIKVVHRFFDQGVVGISVAVMTTLILIFGEIVPKTLAVNNPTGMSLATAPLISLAVRLFSPVKRPLEIAIRAIVRRGSARVQAKLAPFDDHVAEAIALGHSEGILDGFEREMLSGIRPGSGLDLVGMAIGLVAIDEIVSGRSVQEGDVSGKGDGGD